jgi:hypothetical protein
VVFSLERRPWLFKKFDFIVDPLSGQRPRSMSTSCSATRKASCLHNRVRYPRSATITMWTPKFSDPQRSLRSAILNPRSATMWMGLKEKKVENVEYLFFESLRPKVMCVVLLFLLLHIFMKILRFLFRKLFEILVEYCFILSSLLLKISMGCTIHSKFWYVWRNPHELELLQNSRLWHPFEMNG